MFLYAEINDLKDDGPLAGPYRERAEQVIRERHYTRSVPSGKSRYYFFGGAIVVYSIPANKNIGSFLLGREAAVWELTRLWAPDGHERNLLTRAISASVDWFRKDEPTVEALVSYADPNVGHEGGVYRAASWLYTGQSEEGRYYVGPDGVAVARRKFHSGSRCMKKAEIEAAGYRETYQPGKHRFARGLTRRARRELEKKYRPKEDAVIPTEPVAAIVSQAPASLADIARRINDTHEERFGLFLSSLERARECGQLLINARRQLEGHNWLAWLKANVKFTDQTARRYMRIAQNWDTISSKSNNMSDLGLVESLELIGKADNGDAEPRPKPGPLDHLRKYWQKATPEERAAFIKEIQS